MLYFLSPEISQEETEEEGTFTYLCGECHLRGCRTIGKLIRYFENNNNNNNYYYYMYKNTYRVKKNFNS